MKQYSRSIVMMAVLWLVVGAVATPIRRVPDLEARRRSAIDRSMIRFGRSYPIEPSAADLREAFQRTARRGNSFLRFGKSQPFTISTDDLLTLLKSYEDDYESPSKRATNFIRLGRDSKFIRFGRSIDEDRPGYEHSSDLIVSGNPERKGRARDHFVRLGRDSEELNEDELVDEVEDNRRKRSPGAPCNNCQS